MEALALLEAEPRAPGAREADFEPRPLTARVRDLVDTVQQVLCAHPDAADAVPIQYRLARFFYDMNHYQEAAVRFESIAREHSDHELGELAAVLWLDALNVLASRAGSPRAECGAALEAAPERLLPEYCAGPAERDAHPSLCETLDALWCSVARTRAERLGAEVDHEGAAMAYLQQAAECAPADELLYNAAVHFERAHRMDRAIAVRRQLIETYPAAPTALNAAWQVARGLHAVGRYEEASLAYGVFARRYPGEYGRDCGDREECPNAAMALRTAIELTRATGSIRQVRELMALFARNYARRLPAELASLEGALARWLEQRELRAEAHRVIERSLRERGDHLTAVERIEALVMLGRLARRAASARRHLQDAVALADSSSRASDARQFDEPRGTLPRIRAAAAEALYRLAELARAGFTGRPARRSSGSNIAARVERLRAIEAQYARVALYESAPWTIASARRVAEMTLELADALPPGTEEAELRRTGREKLELCFVTGVRTRTFGEATRACGERLSELDPESYPVPRELVGTSFY